MVGVLSYMVGSVGSDGWGIELHGGECWVTCWGVLCYMMEVLGYMVGVLGYMVGSIGLHDGSVGLHGGSVGSHGGEC